VVRETAQPAANAQAAKAPAAAKKGRAAKGQAVVAGVRLSNPERVIFPEQGVTKKELAEYYVSVADWILPWLAGRPLSIVRCPQGREKQCFYQKHLTEGLPPAVHGVQIKEKSGTKTYLVIHDLAGLISLIQFGTLELHPWPAREQSLDTPDYVVFDLDPAPDVAWQRVIAAARHVRKRLKALGLESYVRTSGGKGLHVVVPIEPRYSWDRMRGFAKDFAGRIAADDPAGYVATMTKAKRHGKIFIDHFRNARGATSIVNYSSRARTGAPVAVPLRWSELSALKSSSAYDIRTVPKRLAALKNDPWAGFLVKPQRLPEPD
jgi:bifunctional non-homologous end joining protein LigD